MGRSLFQPTRKGLYFTYRQGSEFSQSGGSQSVSILVLPIRKGPNLEGSLFCQSGRLQFSPIRKCPIFANPEGSHFANPEGSQFHQPGRVPISHFRKGPNFAIPEGFLSGRVLTLPFQKAPIYGNTDGSHFCQSRRFVYSPIRKGPYFANPEGSQFRKSGRLPNQRSGRSYFASSESEGSSYTEPKES